MSDLSDDESLLDKDFKPSFVLVAIDSHANMFTTTNSACSFQMCLGACYEVVNSLLFVKNRKSYSCFGVIIADEFSTALVEFNQNIIDSIKFLKSEKEKSISELMRYMRKGTFDLNQLFLYCMRRFKEVDSLSYKRTLVYITNDDDPAKGDKSKRFTALNTAQNFSANAIDLHLVCLRRDFNYKLFYNELFSVMNVQQAEEIVLDQRGLIQKLYSVIKLRVQSRNFLFFPFPEEKSIHIKVSLRKIISKYAIYNNRHVDKDGNVLIRSKTNDDSILGYKLKNRPDIKFTVEEKSCLHKNDFEIGFTLLMVSERITPEGYVLSNPSLLEAQFDDIDGPFMHFWQYCITKNKVIICVRKFKHDTLVRIVELVPKWANDSRIFIVKRIPFLDDVHLPSPDFVKNAAISCLSNSPTEKQMSIMRSVVKALTGNYHVKMFTDPYLARKKAFLRSKYLEEDMEDVKDLTLNIADVDERLEDLLYTFKNAFNVTDEIKQPKKRRKATAPKTVTNSDS